MRPDRQHPHPGTVGRIDQAAPDRIGSGLVRYHGRKRHGQRVKLGKRQAAAQDWRRVGKADHSDTSRNGTTARLEL